MCSTCPDGFSFIVSAQGGPGAPTTVRPGGGVAWVAHPAATIARNEATDGPMATPREAHGEHPERRNPRLMRRYEKSAGAWLPQLNPGVGSADRTNRARFSFCGSAISTLRLCSDQSIRPVIAAWRSSQPWRQLSADQEQTLAALQIVEA